MRDPAEQIVLEGPPPGSGRPSWLVMVVAVVIALGVGAAVGYGVRGTPSATPIPTLAARASPTPGVEATPTTLPTFAADPCALLYGFPYHLLPGAFAGIVGGSSVGPVVPGTRGCLLWADQGRTPLAAVYVRWVPTSRAEFPTVVNEVFQGDEVAQTSFGTYPGMVVACSHLWAPCQPAAVFLSEPYFVVVALEPGEGDVATVRSLATAILAIGFPAL
jgi:hypothetical protein